MNLYSTGSILLAASILFGGALYAEESKREMKSSVKYFRSFAGYSIPLRLVDEILKEEADELAAYLVAEYDLDGKITAVVKMLSKRQSFKHRYDYFDNGNLRRVRILREDGKVTVHEYDIGGNLQVPTMIE